MKTCFYQRLRDLRTEKNIRQRTLAEDLQVTRSTIASWENQFTEPGLDMVIRIADYFDVTADYLLGRTDDFERRVE